MGNCNLAGLRRVLEVVMASARADETPAIRYQFANDITRVFAHRSALPRRKIAFEDGSGKRVFASGLRNAVGLADGA